MGLLKRSNSLVTREGLVSWDGVSACTCCGVICPWCTPTNRRARTITATVSGFSNGDADCPDSYTCDNINATYVSDFVRICAWTETLPLSVSVCVNGSLTTYMIYWDLQITTGPRLRSQIVIGNSQTLTYELLPPSVDCFEGTYILDLLTDTSPPLICDPAGTTVAITFNGD